MMKFWFREDMAQSIIERYSNWQFINSEAFKQLSTEEQLGTSDLWICATALGEPFDVPGLDGCKAVEILVSGNAPTKATQELFEELGGLYLGEV